MTNTSHIALIEHELDGFHQSLAMYRQQMRAWYVRALDSVSDAADMPSLLGMDRVLRVGNSQTTVSMSDPDFIGSVAVCPLGGKLTIESTFESVYDVPISDIPVEVIGLDDGSATVVMLNEHGKGSHHCTAGDRYQVRVQGGVSAQQVDALFASYSGLTADLEQWLRLQWAGFKPHWELATASAIGSGGLAGSWAAIMDVWDSIKQVQAILEDPLKHIEQLGDQAARLAQIATDAPKVMEQAMLLASDEAALFLLMRTAMVWLDALPPGQIAETAAGFVIAAWALAGVTRWHSGCLCRAIRWCGPTMRIGLRRFRCRPTLDRRSPTAWPKRRSIWALRRMNWCWRRLHASSTFATAC